MLDIKLEKARIEDLQIVNLFQRPDRAFREYFSGSDDEYLTYFNRHGINIHYVSSNLYEAHTHMNEFLNNFKEAINKDLSSWDFRIKSALGAKNLKELEVEDYMVLTINVNESTQELREKFADIFFNTDSCSFCDFRTMDAQRTNHFQLIYNRRGIYEEKDRIFVGKSKGSVSLKEGFELAKDNNFVMADFFAKLAKAGVDDTFSFSYKSNGIMKSMVATSEEILNSVKQKENNTVVSVKHAQIKEQAKEELKQESATKRDSLPKESTYSEINKEAAQTSFRPIATESTENNEIETAMRSEKIIKNAKCKTANSKVTLDNLEIVTQEVIDDYEAKEIEKTRQRLAKSRAEGKKAYDYMSKLMEQGVGFLEVVRAAKQQFREEHTINFASILIQKDIARTTLLKEELGAKNEEISILNDELEKRNDTITKREETINSLKSTLEKSRVEFKLEKEELIEQHKVDLEELTNSAKAEIESITTESQKTINELTESVNELEQANEEAEEIISRNSLQIQNLTKENESLKETEKSYNQLLAKYELLNSQFAKINTTISEINAEKEKLVRENITLSVKSQNLQEKIDEKEKELTKNKENLAETLKKYDILTEKFASVEEVKNKEISELKEILEALKAENEALKAKFSESKTQSKEESKAESAENKDISKKRVLDILNSDDDDEGGEKNKNVRKHKD
ncbi:TPA: hypothetical protein RPV89_001634 [Campylobacter fetus subsp. venerealis]|nr:hypothetical protein [Campylobacter fetus subsp. venerealis]